MRFPKTLSQWLGVFFVCTISSAFSYAADDPDCSAQKSLQWLKLDKVWDGDTLRLADGRKLRVSGINTPELATKQQSAEPLAQQARQAVIKFFAGQSELGVSLGKQQKDRYGRVQASVYHRDGRNLSAHLLSSGLAIQVVIPPNTDNWRCLRRIQNKAKQQKRGLWQQSYFMARHADQLTATDTGFRRVYGRVERVGESRHSWWLTLGKSLSVRIDKADLRHFGAATPQTLLGKTLEVRGWLVDRSRNKAVIKNAYPPFMLKLGHPAMMDIQ